MRLGTINLFKAKATGSDQLLVGDGPADITRKLDVLAENVSRQHHA